MVKRYLHGLPRKLEFTAYILLYILLGSLQYLSWLDNYSRGVAAQIQAFFTIFLAFRFGLLGWYVVLLFCIKDIGELWMVHVQTHSDTTAVAISLKLLVFASSSIIALLVNRQDIQKRKLEKLAITDDLTGAFNQRHFQLTLQAEMERIEKQQGSLGLILVDIDNFKMCNDLYGHEYGDQVLEGTAALLREAVAGENAVVCRNGGDEFSILLPDAEKGSIERTAHHIRMLNETERDRFFRGELKDKITFSMGLSEYPCVSSSKDELLSQADMALYHAKNLGKDAIHFYQDVILKLRKGVRSDHHQLIGGFKALLSSISAKDKYTLGHSERVSTYAQMIGKEMKLSPKDITTLQYAGLLHDIGKVEIPKSLLNKMEGLNAEELDLVRKHPIYSANILEPLAGMGNLVEYVRQHHERYDGDGYPNGLAGEGIQLGARILCVADSFDAMVSERPYRKSLSIEKAFEELKRCSGTQFDPKVVDVFIKCMRTRRRTDYTYVLASTEDKAGA